jgi:hypothetical protein
MQNFINVFFFAIVGITFVIIYALNTYPTKTSFAIIGFYFVASFVLGFSINILSKKIKIVQAKITNKPMY